jgi:hypothetical protein
VNAEEIMHVRNWMDQPEEELYDLNESIRRNVLSRRFGFINKDCLPYLKFELTNTDDEFYPRTAATVAIPIDAGLSDRDRAAISNRRQFVVQRVHRLPDAKARGGAGHPAVQHLDSEAVNRTETCAAVTSSVNGRLRTPADTPPLMYEENLTQSVRRLMFHPSDNVFTPSCGPVIPLFSLSR